MSLLDAVCEMDFPTSTVGMADFKVVKLSPQNLEQLKHITDLLHLFHHRNKNQHRRSIWWRHFTTFRRQVNILLEEYQHLNETPTTHLERTKKKTKDKETEAKILDRLTFWRDVMVPKWQHAFSQIVADGRFATLGLVLIASLAQVCQMVGVIAAFEDLGQAEVEKAIREFGKEYWEVAGETKGPGDGDAEDFGEVVARDLISGSQSNKEDFETTELSTQSTIMPSKRLHNTKTSAGISAATSAEERLTKPVRKKRKKGNAIDNLFSNLD